MHKDVFAAPIRGDEAKTLVGIVPLHRTDLLNRRPIARGMVCGGWGAQLLGLPCVERSADFFRARLSNEGAGTTHPVTTANETWLVQNNDAGRFQDDKI
jgi:hypothetical protein